MDLLCSILTSCFRSITSDVLHSSQFQKIKIICYESFLIDLERLLNLIFVQIHLVLAVLLLEEIVRYV